MLEKLSTSQRKVLNWLGFIVVVGVGFMLIQPSKNPVADLSSSKQISTFSQTELNSHDPSHYVTNVEQRLQKIISQIEGAGKVAVYVTLERSSQLVIAESTTEDISGDQHRTVKTPITLRTEGGSKEVPLVITEYEPQLRGVLIVASGATNPDVRYRILRATETALQLPMYKIEVLPKEI